LVSDSSAFDRVESHPLTLQQRRAILTNDNTNLIVAGAGTGKTSTIVGKVDFLMRHRLAEPEEILLVCYNKSAADELGSRIGSLLGHSRVQATTFHALGLCIIGEAGGRKPSVSKLAEDMGLRRGFLRSQVRALMEDAGTCRLITDLFSRYLDESELRPPTEGNGSPADALTLDQQLRRERIKGLKSLNGMTLKSRQEVQIANWLTLQGIRWEYEAPYKHSTASAQRSQYRPDFFLPDHEVYLEHFGVDRQGKTAPYVDQKAYVESMAWKLTTHRQHGTRLIATYSYQFTEGTVFEVLESTLKELGVSSKALTCEELDAITSKANRPFSDFVTLLDQFLSTFKGSSLGQSGLEGRIATARDRAFASVFFPILKAYQQELLATECVDFDDMISLARKATQSRRYVSKFRYLIVDEFQDISENRLGLLLDLAKHVKHPRLFAVGDDWQAIYRFAGADVGIITKLEKWTGPFRRVDLDTTFRYGQELLDASSAFVTRNPAQLRKNLKANSGVTGTRPIYVVLSERDADGSKSNPLEWALKEIIGQLKGKRGSVKILGRYRFNEPKELPRYKARLEREGIELEFLTAHRAKGTEADFVIVLGLESGLYGFPSNVSDDPLMRLVLSEEETFSYAEERRLFYVALTRAREKVYLIVPNDQASPFVHEELLSEEYENYVERVGKITARHTCPKCKGETIKLRTGSFGAFWGCTNYPRCDGRLSTCPACKKGALVPPEGWQGGDVCTDCGIVVGTTASLPRRSGR
jgi:DNA helicase-4